MKSLNTIARIYLRSRRDLRQWVRVSNRSDVPRETKLDAMARHLASLNEYNQARNENRELARGLGMM